MIRLRGMGFSFCLIAVASCGGSQSSGGGGSHAVPAMSGEVTCYRGSASIQMSGGSASEADVYWRRGYDAAAGTITEDAVTMINGAPSRTWTDITLAPGSDSLIVLGKYKGGKFGGLGKAVGDKGAWTEWTVETELDVGPKVVSNHKVEGNDIVSYSEVSSNGTVSMKVDQRVSPISPEECQTAFSQWPPL